MSIYEGFGYAHVGIAFVGSLILFVFAFFGKKWQNNALLNSIALAMTAATYLAVVGLSNSEAAWARWMGYAFVKMLIAFSLASVLGRSVTRCFMVGGLTFTYNALGAVLYFLSPVLNRWLMFGGGAMFLVMTVPLLVLDEDMKINISGDRKYFLRLIHLGAFVLAQVAIGIVLGTGAPLANVLNFGGQTIAYSVLDLFAIYMAAAINVLLPSVLDGSLEELVAPFLGRRRVQN
jgi:hypothetical protein